MVAHLVTIYIYATAACSSTLCQVFPPTDSLSMHSKRCQSYAILSRGNLDKYDECAMARPVTAPDALYVTADFSHAIRTLDPLSNSFIHPCMHR